MAHFAQIDENSIVTTVIVVGNEDCLDSDGNESEAVGVAFCQSLLGSDTNWVQTSYNDNIRIRYAAVGYKHDSTSDVFYDPVSPYPSWVFNTSTWEWDAPVALPDNAVGAKLQEVVSYTWDEYGQEWLSITEQNINHA